MNTLEKTNYLLDLIPAGDGRAYMLGFLAARIAAGERIGRNQWEDAADAAQAFIDQVAAQPRNL